MISKSFLLYRDLCENFRDMSDDQIGKLMRTICFDDYEPDNFTKLLAHPFKMALVRDAEKSRRGEYHWNWKNGISNKNNAIRNSAEYKDWRKSVFLRDGYTCQYCQITGGALHAHHIKSFAGYHDFRFDVDNGITLCKSCHKEEHRRLK